MALDLTILNGSGDRSGDGNNTFSGNALLSIAVIDSRLADLDVLLEGLPKNVTPYILHPQQDAIPQINALISSQDIHSLYLIGHGRAGAMELGKDGLNIDTIERYAGIIGSWKLQEILLYGCEVGQDRNFVQRLHEMSGAGVGAASSRLGCGNWELDLSVGSVSDTSLLNIKYNYHLVSFSSVKRFALGQTPISLSLGDLNGDGDLDIVTVNRFSDDISVLLGEGNGDFTTSTFSIDNGNNQYGFLTSADLGDINGDGNLDIVISGTLSLFSPTSRRGIITVFLGDGDGKFITAQPLESILVAFITGRGDGAKLGDINGDKDLDIVSISSNGNNVSVIQLNPTSIANTLIVNPTSVALGDINGDGNLDVVTSSPVFSDFKVNVLFGDGNASFSGGITFGNGQIPNSSVVDVSGRRTYVSLGDLDGDGFLDIVSSNPFVADLTLILSNEGRGIVFERIMIANAANRESLVGVTLGDVNSDGNLDIVVGVDDIDAEDLGRISILLGDGSGKFGSAINFKVDDPSEIALGDINRDGLLDIVTTTTSDEASVFINTTNISFPNVLSIERDNLSPSNAKTLAYTITFSEAVIGVDSTDFNLITTGAITGAIITSVSGEGNVYRVNVNTGEGEGDGKLRLDLSDDDTIRNTANNPLSGVGIGNGNFTGEIYTIDKLSPTVVSILRNDTNPTDTSVVAFTVTFSEAVTGVNSDSFILSSVGVTGASILSTSGNESIYTVTANTGINNGTLRLNLVDNDKVFDLANNALGGLGIGNGNFTGEEYIIEKLAVKSILRGSPNPANGASIVFAVGFNKAVTGVDSSDFILASTGEINGAKINSVTGSGGIYTVTVDTGNGNGTLGINLIDDDSIRDSENNALGGSGNGNGDFFNGEVYTIDKSTDPLNIRAVGGEFKDNDEDGDVEFNGTVIIGRIDGTTELIRIEGGTVEYDDKEVRVTNGTVFSLIGNVSAPLFRGSFTIPFNTATTSSLDDDLRNINGDFRLGGGAINFTSLSLNKNRIGLGADFKLPPEIGGDIVASSAFDTLSITKDGVGLGGDSGRFSLDTPPKRNFRFFDLFDVEASDLSLEYVAVEEKIKLQGKFVLDSFVKESSPKITLDLSDDNFIEIKDGKADIKGSLTLETEIKTKSGWGLSEVKLNIDTKEKDVSGSTKITFPFLKRIIEAEVELGFKLPIPPLELDKISFDFDNLNFQIPTYPLVFIQRFGGEINNFAPSSKDPIEFSGKSGATLGPQIDFSFNAPAFDINIKKTIELIRADLDIKFSSDELKGTGKVTLLDDKLLTGSGITTLNLEKKFFELKGNFSLIDGLITTNSSFKVDPKFNINLVGEGSANIPKFIPTIGGQSLVDADLLVQYKNNDKLSDDFIAVWTTVKAEVKGIDIDIPLGLKVFFNGQVQQIFSGLPPTNSFIVAPNKNWILLTADWENSSDSTKIRIKKPDGTFLVESDFEANNIALVEDLNNSDTRAAVVLNPSAGIWDIEVVDPTGLGKIEYNGIGDSVAPSIAINSPSTDTISKGNINIGFNASDSDSTAEVKLFYDDDNLGLNGILIADGIVENDGASNFTWNTEDVPIGDYFIYAMIMDDSNIPVFSDYSTAKISIAALNTNNAPVLSNAISNQTATEDTAFTFTFPVNTFTDIDAGDVLTYSATLENGNALPTWLTFDPTARTFSGTPSNDNVGSLNIKVTATDSFGATANDSFTTIISNDMVGEPFWGLDIDGDGKVNALSDGIMVVRYMFGAAFSGNALINGAISPDATRDLAGIQTYLQEGVTKGYLDIDGDGKVNALSDGIMAVRYMFGAAFSGNALINGAISPDATRNLAGIQTYLSGLTNPI